GEREPIPHEGEAARLAIAWTNRPLPGLRPAGRLHDLLAFVERAEHDDAALARLEGLMERLYGLNGFGARMDRLRPAPVFRLRKRDDCTPGRQGREFSPHGEGYHRAADGN